MPSRPAAMLSNFTMAVRGASHPFFFSYGSAVETLRGRFFCFSGERKQAGKVTARCGYRNCVPLISSLKVSPRWSAARLERIIRVRKISK